MNLLDMRTAIIDDFKTNLADIRDNCLPYGGKFGKDDVKRYAMKSPAVLVSCLGLVEAKADGCGSVDAVFAWGSFIITTDKQGLLRDVGALAILTAITGRIPDNKWGLADVGYPEQVRGENLYSGEIDKVGVALWGVTWRQSMTLGGLDETTLDIFAQFHADWDIAPKDGVIAASDDVTLPQT